MGEIIIKNIKEYLLYDINNLIIDQIDYSDFNLSDNLLKNLKECVLDNLTMFFDKLFKDLIINTDLNENNSITLLVRDIINSDEWKLFIDKLFEEIQNLKGTPIYNLSNSLIGKRKKEGFNKIDLLEKFKYDTQSTLEKKEIVKILFEIPDSLLSAELFDYDLMKKIEDWLMDDDDEVFHMSYCLNIKLLSINSNNRKVDLFCTILDSVQYYYATQNNRSYSISIGYSIHKKLVQLLHLILDVFQRRILNFAHLKEGELEIIYTKFIDLLSTDVNVTSKKSDNVVTPLEIISCVDPKSIWSRRMFYSITDKQILCKLIENNNGFLEIMIQHVLNWFESPIFPSLTTLHDKVNEFDSEINEEYLQFALFNHCFNTVINIYQFIINSKIFNKEFLDNEFVLPEVILGTIFAFLKNYDTIEKTDHIKFPKKLILTLSEECVKLFNYNDNKHILLLEKIFDDHDETIYPYSTKIIESILLNCPIKYLCKTIENKKLITEINFAIPGEVHSIYDFWIHIFNLANKLLMEKENANLFLLSQLIEICTYLCTDINGFHNIMEYKPQLIQTAAYCYKHLLEVTDKYSNYNPIHSVKAKLNKFLYTILIYPKGYQRIIDLEYRVYDLILNNSFNYKWSKEWISSVTTLTCFQDVNKFIENQHKHFILEFVDDYINYDVESNYDKILYLVLAYYHDLSGVKMMLSTFESENTDSPYNIVNLIITGALSDTTSDLNYQVLGLEALKIITANLDSALYLENQLKLQEKLISIQKQKTANNINSINNNNVNNFVLDETIKLIQKILAKLFYCTINIQPDYELNNKLDLKKFKGKPKNEFSKFLRESKNAIHDLGWLKAARKIYRNSDDNLKLFTFIELIEKIKTINGNSTEEIIWIKAANNIPLLTEELLGIQLIIRYVTSNNIILQNANLVAENLSNLIRIFKATFEKESTDFRNFDWFISITFIMCGGNIDKTLHILKLLNSFPIINIIYKPFLTEIKSQDKFWHTFTAIVSNELPRLYAFLLESGIPCWILLKKWTRECFLNVLEWNEIYKWIIFAILYPPEYLIYFYVSILKHMETSVILLGQYNCTWKFYSEQPKTFRQCNYAGYIEKLSRKYSQCTLNILNL